MDKDKFLDISNKMIERYSTRYQHLGKDVRTLGWGSIEQQSYRFAQTFEGITFTTDKTILDIGCGFGDYLAQLKARNFPFKNYIGWDINPDLIEEAKQIWSSPLASFEVKNIGSHRLEAPVADIGIMLGVLNLNLKNQIDNYDYSFQFIENAFSSVKELLIVDFLSTKHTPEYPVEDFVFYHNPAKVLEFALSLSPNVMLKHHYAAIPQKEFMLFIYKS
ncbi:class I SAM-dependent methyltransferase [Hugenholtzia roseola]|uniref:class I SAM-dependent methyltransferase n=1 Tax=Hugenholtzia roseola TaxID=1002 RepID=UPI00047B8DFC|nr:class I SAM-dependent methyltransferase [Hugenholtzia roseola]